MYQNLYRFTGGNLFWKKRIVFVAIVLALLAIEVSNLSETEPLGFEFLRKMSYLLFILFVVITPISFGNAFSEERKKNTLGILFLTGLPASQIICCKTFSRIFAMVLYLLGTLPVFMVCFSFGGVSIGQILYVFAVLVTCIFFYGIIGLLCSIIGFSWLYTGIIALGVFAVQAILYDPSIGSFTSWHTLQFVMDGYTESAYTGLLVEWTMCFVLFLITAKILPDKMFVPLRRKTPGSGIRGIVQNRFWTKNMAILGERKLRAINFANPIAWKDYYFLHYPKVSNPNQKKSCVSGCLVILFILYAYPFIFALLIFTLFVSGLKTFGQESKVFELFLMTNISNEEIIKGKLQAIYKGMSWFKYYLKLFFIVSIVFPMIGVILTADKDAVIFAMAMIFITINVISLCFFVTFVSMLFSFRYSDVYKALVYSIFTIFLCQLFLYGNLIMMNPFFGGIIIPIVHFLSSYFICRHMIRNLRNERFVLRFSRG